MIKKELLSMKKISATKEMQEMVKNDIGEEARKRHYDGSIERYWIYKRYLYFRAIVQNNLLKVACFRREDIARKILEPIYEIYISKSEEKWLTYSVRDGKWLTAKIDNLEFNFGRGAYHGNYPWQSEETRKVVNQYLDTEHLSVKAAVLYFQNETRKEIAKRKERSITDRIDGIMENVPEFPKDYEEWVINSAFSKEKSLFYKYGTQEGYCTACESEVRVKDKLHHLQETKCPKCKKEVTARAWKKQKNVTSWKWIGILQKLEDRSGYVLRLSECKIARNLEDDWRMGFSGFWEKYRIILDNNFVQREYFEWGEQKKTGLDRWNRPQDIKRNYYGYYAPSVREECILYHRNIKRLRKETFAKYIPWEQLLAKKQGCYCYPIKALRNMKRKPQVEFFIKAGMIKMAYKILETDGTMKYLDFNKKRLWEVMKIPKNQMKQCTEMDISYKQLEIMQVAYRNNMKLTNEQLKFYGKYLDEDLASTLFKYGHQERMYRYILEELNGDGKQLADYIDYLRDLEYLRIPAGKTELFPKGFQTVHYNIAVQRQEKENEIAKMELCEKNMEFQQLIPMVQEIYSMENEQFKVVIPTCKEDFQVEGRMNHNCVGGTYFDKMLNGKCVVFFLRKKENIDEAFCTVEMRESKVIQCRATRNSIAPPEAMEFMEQLAKEVQRRIEKRAKEMQIVV